MRLPHSLQGRLSLSIGILLTLGWVAAAGLTAVLLHREIDEVFDSALEETGQRLLALSVLEVLGREGDGPQRLAPIRAHDEYFTYVVRDRDGRILLQSHAADPAIFPPWDGRGLRDGPRHRFYNEDALQGSVRITVAEPLSHRAEVMARIGLGLGLPVLVLLPLVLWAMSAVLARSIAPLRRFRDRLAARGARDLSPVPGDDLPDEIAPVAASLNDLLARLKAAFEAERSFAANAAHEFRTPLAGAIAQAQRLQRETADPAARARAAEIEAALKRLTRLAERLLQLARAEGGRLRLDEDRDLRPVARLVVEDLDRQAGGGRVLLRLPDRPVMSDLDPDAFGILCRNLVENALRHGDPHAPVEVTLDPDATLRVANDGPVLPPEVLARLPERFQRGQTPLGGSGLGLAIVAAIAERTGARLELASPRPGAATGFAAALRLPSGGAGAGGAEGQG